MSPRPQWDKRKCCALVPNKTVTNQRELHYCHTRKIGIECLWQKCSMAAHFDFTAWALSVFLVVLVAPPVVLWTEAVAMLARNGRTSVLLLVHLQDSWPERVTSGLIFHIQTALKSSITVTFYCLHAYVKGIRYMALNNG